jgi:metallophosphoesterase superfamily enzyme
MSAYSAGGYRFESWQLLPEGAIYHAGDQTAVIADLHLGYEWARGAAGDCVVAHSLDECLARLSLVLARAKTDCLVVAGDLVESPRPCRRTFEDVRRLRAWLTERGVRLLVLEGNHDRSRRAHLRDHLLIANHLPTQCTVAGWTISHGDQPLAGSRTISGHHHPVLRCEGTAAPCFLVGPGRIVLPAFSSNAAGCDVLSIALPGGWHKLPFRCIASTGRELLDFGPLPALRRRLRSEEPIRANRERTRS